MNRSASLKADPVFPPRRSSRRSSLSSPARVSGRLSSLVQQFKDTNMDSFASTPGRSILSDNTDVEQPKRQSWWKKLDDNNSRDIIEALGNEKVDDANNVLEVLDVEILSQEKERRNFSLDLPDSSGSETIDSIIIPERKLFTQKENIPQKKFSNMFGPRESMAKLYKPNTEKIKDITTIVGSKKLFSQAPTDRHKIFEKIIPSPKKSSQDDSFIPPKKLFNQENHQRKTIFPDVINSSPKKSGDIYEPETGPKNLFRQNTNERKSIFPSALLDTSADKTANKTTEVRKEVQGQVRSLFGNRPTTKRKNMFADFIVVESEDEVPDIKPRMFGFGKKPDTKRRGSSSSHALTDAEDAWMMLPSSTMMDHMEGLSSPVKRPKLSTIPREREGGEYNIMEGSQEEAEESEINADPINDSNNEQNESEIDNKEMEEQNYESIDNDEIAELPNVTHDTTGRNRKKQETPANDEIAESPNVTHDTAESLNDTHDSTDRNRKKQETQANDEIPESPIITHDTAESENVTNDTTGRNRKKQEIAANDKIAESPIVTHNTAESANVMNDTTGRNRKKQETPANDKIAESPNVTHDSTDSNRKKQEIFANDVIAESPNMTRDIAKSLTVTHDTAKSPNVTHDTAKSPNATHDTMGRNRKKQIKPAIDEIAESPDVTHDTTGHNSNNNKTNLKSPEAILHDKTNNKQNESEIDNEEMEEQNHESIDNDEISELPNATHDSTGRDRTMQETSSNDEITESPNITHDCAESPNVTHDTTGRNGTMQQTSAKDKIAESPNVTHDTAESPNATHDSTGRDRTMQETSSNDEITESPNITHDSAESPNVTHDTTGRNGTMQQTSAKDKIAESPNVTHDTAESENVTHDTTGSNRKTQEISAHDGIAKSPDVTHDTTGHNRNNNQTNLKSPEAILHDKTNKNDSFQLLERKTSLRKTKSLIHSPKLRDSLGSTKNSSAEGSGWDSHRTTRKTLRQTFGKDFTPRKSLRALVMEKSAKRQTENPIRESVGYPQANSTEIVQNFTVPREMEVVTISADNTANNTAEIEYSASESAEPKTPEVSMRTRQTTLEMYLENIKREVMERKQKSEVVVKKLLSAPKRDISDFYRPSIKRLPRTSNLGYKPRTIKSKPSAIPLESIPEEILQDMKYKPPKRFMKNDASWITKRLYKYLETKLEPRYDFKARVKAEKFVEHLYYFTKSIQKLEQAPQDSIKELKIIMARLDIVVTHHEFYEFFYEFMPREVRIKVVPNITNKLPMPKHGIFNQIIRAER